jgi:phosphoglycolate phosphatase
MPAQLAGCTIAFDLDGTLVDTVGDIHRALNQVLAQEGMPPAALADVRNFVGLGARALLVRAFGAHGIHHDEAKLDRLTDLYVEANAADISALSRPFPGVIEALDVLKGWGATLSVCTNKRRSLSVQLLTALRMQHHFAVIAGGDDVKNRKPHPDHFIHAIRAAGGDPAKSAMVGDSINDVLSAKAANAPVAIYAFGYTDTAPELLGADAVFKHFDELPDLAARLLRPQPTPRT